MKILEMLYKTIKVNYNFIGLFKRNSEIKNKKF